MGMRMATAIGIGFLVTLKMLPLAIFAASSAAAAATAGEQK